MVYGNSKSNVWDTPLMEKDGDASQISSSKESIDITKGDTDTSASTDTVSQLLQDLAFLRKDFNDSIQLSNQK